MKKMQELKFTHSFLRSTKIMALAICLVILFSLEITPLAAQLNAARNLSGTWQSSSSGMYYEMDALGSGVRQADVTATFTMDITQSGNQITIALYLNPISWVVDPAFTQMYGSDVTGAPPVAGEIDFSGTVSSSSFTASETGSQLTSEQLTGTFTSDIITATLSGTAETTDQNGIVVTLVSSSTSSTPNPTSSAATPTATNQAMAARYYSDVQSVKGQAWTVNSKGNSPLTSGQIASGTEIQTGSNGIVSFDPPNQGGEVYVGANSIAGFAGLTSEPAPDNGIQYMIYPPVSSGVIFPNGMEQLTEMKYTIPLDVAFAVLLFSEPIGQAAAVGLFIEGGAFLIPDGAAYVKETVSHLISVPQGALAGENTEYAVDVSSSGATTVQVIDGPVYFMDPVSNNTVTVNTNQVLTLPPAQPNGFSVQELRSYVSTLNPASVNHWWTQGSANSFSLSGLMSQTVMLAIVAIVVIVVVTTAVVAVMRRRKVIRQIHASESPATMPT